ncbi:TIGR03557 family F420-dependent LLM class oxidoreductase [Actinomadura physcomitrii]|uniref:TIGR03557 family F420-dependent LLM class oxidoreductase n=1 Tax=Actinomadura physcomitrii TaxID=2650748 RepID=UPI001F420FC8|nr:TIGR03557 family F420-dependent LLM class oxidoreductase [Actinomadura physcomitrii]
MEFGYTLLCEQTPPKQLVTDLVEAEDAGFDYSVISDHYFPWLEAQGHSAYAWSVLGALAQATHRIPLMTFVTCPIMRYHPAVVAQKAATVGILSDGRFTLGLGAGENLNEHVVGRGWPSADVRHAMFAEAVEIIRALFSGDYVNYEGEHYRVDSAKLWDVPDRPVPIGMAAFGARAGRLAAQHADLLISDQPVGDVGLPAGRPARHGRPGRGLPRARRRRRARRDYRPLGSFECRLFLRRPRRGLRIRIRVLTGSRSLSTFSLERVLPR